MAASQGTTQFGLNTGDLGNNCSTYLAQDFIYNKRPQGL